MLRLGKSVAGISSSEWIFLEMKPYHVLDAYLLKTLEEARIISDEWQYKYNNIQPHDALKWHVKFKESLMVFPLKQLIEH